MDAKAVERQAAEIVATANKRVEHVGLAEAKRIWTEAQRELRALKKSIADVERQIQASAKEATAKASAKQHLGLQMVTGKKSTAGRVRQAQRQSIQTAKDRQLAPWRKAKLRIDSLLSSIDATKGRITTEMERQKAATAARAPQRTSTPSPGSSSSPSPPPPPPGWQKDPTGRHEHRYWDGARWTEHVGDGGHQSIDPYV